MNRPLVDRPVLFGALLGLVVGLPAIRAVEEPPVEKAPVERGVLRGYPEGKYEPNKPVTRLELAIVMARLTRALQSDANATPQAEPPRTNAGDPNLPATRLLLGVHLARLLRAVESNPGAAQRAKPPKMAVKAPSLPARIPKWARGEMAYLVERGYPVSLPNLYKDLGRPALQKDLSAALTWALGSLAARGYIPPGDLAAPRPEPEPKP